MRSSPLSKDLPGDKMSVVDKAPNLDKAPKKQQEAQKAKTPNLV